MKEYFYSEVALALHNGSEAHPKFDVACHMQFRDCEEWS
jgi:hypothetical protein